MSDVPFPYNTSALPIAPIGRSRSYFSDGKKQFEEPSATGIQLSEVKRLLDLLAVLLLRLEVRRRHMVVSRRGGICFPLACSVDFSGVQEQ